MQFTTSLVLVAAALTSTVSAGCFRSGRGQVMWRGDAVGALDGVCSELMAQKFDLGQSKHACRKGDGQKWDFTVKYTGGPLINLPFKLLDKVRVWARKKKKREREFCGAIYPSVRIES